MLSFRPTAANRTEPTRRDPCRVVLAVTACLCTPLAAHALGPVDTRSGPPAVEVSSELVARPDAGMSGGALPATSTPQPAMLSGAVRNTVWARRGAAAVGVGVEAPMGTVASSMSAATGANRTALVSPNLVVGVALDTSPRSRVVLDTPLPYRATSTDPSLNPTTTGREVRLGLVVKPADPLKTLRGGQLFKVELSGRSQVALKPRSGGVALSYSSKF